MPDACIFSYFALLWSAAALDVCEYHRSRLVKHGESEPVQSPPVWCVIAFGMPSALPECQQRSLSTSSLWMEELRSCDVKINKGQLC